MMTSRPLFALFLSIFATMLGMGILSPLIAIYSTSPKFNATGIWLAIIFSGFSFARIISAPPVGRLSDIKGRKRVLMAGLLIYSIIPFGYLYATSLYGLSLIRLIHGFSSAFIVPVAIASVGDISPRGEEGKYMGLFSISLFLGMGIGPVIGGVIKDRFGMDYIFYSMEILFLIALILVFLFLPNMKGTPKKDNTKSLSEINTLTLSIFGFLNSLGRGTLIAFLPIFAYRTLNLSASLIGLIFTSNIILTFLLQYPSGLTADKTSKLGLIIAGSFIYALFLLFIPFSKNFLELLILNLSVGMGNALSTPASMSAAAEVGRDCGMGTTMGRIDMAMGMGMIVGPLISGVILDSFGIKEVFYAVGMINLFGTALLFLICKKGDRIN
jgi:MFS family permease